MKALVTLIKIHRNKIDQIVIDIKNCETERLKQVAALEKLFQDLKSETDKFADSVEFAFMLEKYREHINHLKSEVSNKIIALEKKVVDLRASLRIEFNSLKKFEHVLKNRLLQEKVAAEKKAEAEIADNIMMKYNYK
jgi:hypothetical protein